MNHRPDSEERTIRQRLIAALTLSVAVTTWTALAQNSTVSQEHTKPLLDRWEAAYASAGRTIAARNQIQAEIQTILIQHPHEVWAYEAATLGYNHLNDNDDALRVLRAYLRGFPNDTTLDSRIPFFFGNWGTPQDLKSLPERWHGHVDYWQRLLQADDRANAPPDELERVGNEILKRTPKAEDPGGNQRFDIAEIWLNHDVDPRHAERVAREAVQISETGKRPDVNPGGEKDRLILDRLLIININRSALGWSLYREGRYREALVELKRAASIVEHGSIRTAAVFYRLGRTLEQLHQPSQALDAYYRELAWGNLEKPTEDRVQIVYRQLHGSLGGLEVAERTRVNNLAMQWASHDTALISDMNEPLGRFDLLDANGVPLDLKQYRGKLVIVDFWATWCGQCLVTLKQADALERELPNQLVVIAPSQDTELTRAKAETYFPHKGYRFVLVFDDEHRRQIQLPYIPTRLLLDRAGRLRFMEFGAAPEGGVLLENKVRELMSQ